MSKFSWGGFTNAFLQSQAGYGAGQVAGQDLARQRADEDLKRKMLLQQLSDATANAGYAAQDQARQNEQWGQQKQLFTQGQEDREKKPTTDALSMLMQSAGSKATPELLNLWLKAQQPGGMPDMPGHPAFAVPNLMPTPGLSLPATLGTSPAMAPESGSANLLRQGQGIAARYPSAVDEQRQARLKEIELTNANRLEIANRNGMIRAQNEALKRGTAAEKAWADAFDGHVKELQFSDLSPENIPAEAERLTIQSHGPRPGTRQAAPEAPSAPAGVPPQPDLGVYGQQPHPRGVGYGERPSIGMTIGPAPVPGSPAAAPAPTGYRTRGMIDVEKAAASERASDASAGLSTARTNEINTLIGLKTKDYLARISHLGSADRISAIRAKLEAGRLAVAQQNAATSRGQLSVARQNAGTAQERLKVAQGQLSVADRRLLLDAAKTEFGRVDTSIKSQLGELRAPAQETGARNRFLGYDLASDAKKYNAARPSDQAKWDPTQRGLIELYNQREAAKGAMKEAAQGPSGGAAPPAGTGAAGAAMPTKASTALPDDASAPDWMKQVHTFTFKNGTAAGKSSSMSLLQAARIVQKANPSLDRTHALDVAHQTLFGSPMPR